MLLLPPACPHVGLFTFLPGLILNPGPKSQPHSSPTESGPGKSSSTCLRGREAPDPQGDGSQGPSTCWDQLLLSLPTSTKGTFAPQSRRNFCSSLGFKCWLQDGRGGLIPSARTGCREEPSSQSLGSSSAWAKPKPRGCSSGGRRVGDLPQGYGEVGNKLFLDLEPRRACPTPAEKQRWPQTCLHKTSPAHLHLQTQSTLRPPAQGTSP